MFETHDSAELPFLAVEGQHFWTYVDLYFNSPWFLAEFETPQSDEAATTRTVLLSSVSQLIELLQREDVTLKHVQLSSPRHMNGAGSWRVEPLHEIWERARPGVKSGREYVFLVETGKFYGEYSGEISAIDASESTIIFAVG